MGLWLSGCLQEVVAQGGSTVIGNHISYKWKFLGGYILQGVFNVLWDFPCFFMAIVLLNFEKNMFLQLM